MAFLSTFYYPVVMAFVFAVCLYWTKIPAKGRFLFHTCVALGIAVFLAHVNRIFNLWPEYRYFPSGHMTFCFGASLSLGMLRPWTLAITLPILVPFGMALVSLHFHSVLDVLGAFPLVLIVYALVQKYWGLMPKTGSIGDAD